jgi:cytochrome oxidase assembly protein ShyY1
MTRRLPVIPTAIVALVVAGCVWAGMWNLGRAKLHSAELQKVQAASRLPPITFPTVPASDDQLPVYRFASGNCLKVVSRRTDVGESASGEPGFAIIFDCATGSEGPGMSVQVGWSKDPNARTPWTGGLVSGVIIPDRKSRIRLVASGPAPGLQPNGTTKATITVSPAQNRGYAFQFFSFAVIALVIYSLALRKRLREGK